MCIRDRLCTVPGMWRVCRFLSFFFFWRVRCTRQFNVSCNLVLYVAISAPLWVFWGGSLFIFVFVVGWQAPHNTRCTPFCCLDEVQIFDAWILLFLVDQHHTTRNEPHFVVWMKFRYFDVWSLDILMHLVFCCIFLDVGGFRYMADLIDLF